jgi:hypothetical protein
MRKSLLILYTSIINSIETKRLVLLSSLAVVLEAAMLVRPFSERILTLVRPILAVPFQVQDQLERTSVWMLNETHPFDLITVAL